jgi:DNA-binding response OmpR family regulator
MKILVIDDNPSIRDVLKLALEQKTFAVDIAEDGEKGSFLARTNDYDLIILDNVLPHKMGGHVCKEIRDYGKLTPILILSEKSEVLTKIELLDLGADDYMTKPFSFEELFARIRTILRRPDRIDIDKISAHNLVLDKVKQTLFKNEKEVLLTKKEYCLIELFMSRQNVILTRAQILEKVWDINRDPFSNTIETHILNLRKKIGDKNKKIIESIPSRGYRFKNNINA